MLRKIICLITAAMLVLGAGANAAYFTDLQDGSYDWAKDTINKLADDGVIRGYSDGTYGPGKQVTRQEAFTLFSRAVGVNDFQNAYTVEFNQNEYKNIASKYNTYAKAELCLMLERKLLKEDEIDTYLSETNKDKPMLRHEAAVLIAKILNIRNSFDENASYALDFTDADEIPAESRAAVAFAKDMGIISGMGDGSFAPYGEVTRAQIAIMLDRVIDKLNISYKTGSVTNVYEDENAIDIDGNKYEFDSSMLFAINSKPAKLSDVKTGDNVTIISTDMGVWFADVIRLSELVFETVRGKVARVDSSSIILSDGREFGISAFMMCHENSEEKKIEEMNFDNPVTLQTVNGFVRSIEGTGTICEYEKAQILSISTIPSKKIKFEDEYGFVQEFEVGENAKITQNGYTSELEELKPKSVMYIKADKEVIQNIGVYSTFEQDSAVVDQIVIDKKESSIVLSGGVSERIKIESDTRFTDEEGNTKSIYDLRIGDSVNPEFEKGKLAVVRHTKYVAPTSFSGTVKKIDASENTMTLDTGDEQMNIKISTSVVVIRYEDAAKLSLKSVKEGDHVVIAGEYDENSEFVCTSIIL